MYRLVMNRSVQSPCHTRAPRENGSLLIALLSMLALTALLSAVGVGEVSAQASTDGAQQLEMTEDELNISKDLISRIAREKRKALKDAREELNRRKARLLRLEENVLRRYKALRMLQEELTSAHKRSKAEEDEAPQDSATSAERKAARAQEVRKLAKSFESMKPAAAAQVIEVMEDELVVDVLRVVNPRKSGKILGALEPKTAARVSELMTNMRRRR